MFELIVHTSSTLLQQSLLPGGHQRGSAQAQEPRAWDAGLCHPLLPSFPQLGELQVLSCARDAPAELQPTALLCAPAHPTGLYRC